LIYLRNLKFYHKDPFDRLIISQAKIEKMFILTDDNLFNDYGIDLL